MYKKIFQKFFVQNVGWCSIILHFQIEIKLFLSRFSMYLNGDDHEICLIWEQFVEIPLPKRASRKHAVGFYAACVEQHGISEHSRQRSVAHEVSGVRLARAQCALARVELLVEHCEYFVRASLDLRYQKSL